MRSLTVTLVSSFDSVRAPGLVCLLAAALSGCGGDGGEPTRVVEAGGLAPAPGQSPELGPGDEGSVDIFEDEVDVGGGACASSVAATTFTSAVCSCEDTNVAGFLRTRSFRSSAGPNAPEELG